MLWDCFVLLNSFAEMCAGSWILGIFANRSNVYGAHGCHLACLLPLLWRPGGPSDDPETILGRSRGDPGTLEGTRKDTVRSRRRFNRSFVDLGEPFYKFFGTLG